jgi:hypothetical protein
MSVKEAGKYFCNYLEEKTCICLHFRRYLKENERRIYGYSEYECLKVPQK